MIKKLAISLTMSLACVSFVACNESVEETSVTATCAAIKSFSLSADDKVLDNLDSVFFSIDLVKGEIFNADSLPFGTNVKKLVPVISLLDGASSVTLDVTRAGAADTTYNYLANSTDSIDFSNPVKMRVVSYDGRTERSYTIKVNVGTMKPDSLSWDIKKRKTLPSTFNIPNEQRTVSRGGNIACLTRYQSDYSLATSYDCQTWDARPVSFPFTPQLKSFAATTDAFYILSDAGELYTSADGYNWNSTGQTWHAIYGGYRNQILGSAYNDGAWTIESYPAGTSVAMPSSMPVSGTSQPVETTFPMAVNPQIVILGGRLANGTLSKDAWGFDGTNWAAISKYPLSQALEGIALISYYSFVTNTNWTTTQYVTLLAFGGRSSDGKLSDTVYMSNDYGYTWKAAPDEMQLPSYIPAMADSQAFVIDETINAGKAPARISRPIESWDCPYIYLFGGVNQSNATYNTVWKGAINRLSFKPVI